MDPNGGGAVSASTFYWPYGLGYVAGRLIVADTGNRRVLAWDGVPEPGQPADAVLGQDGPDLALENRGGAPSARSFRWPHAAAGDARALFIADAGNHRVLAWSPPADDDRDADGVLGQADFTGNAEFPYARQHGGALRFPYAVACDWTLLLVADTANNRLLAWRRGKTGLPDGEALALGQPDLHANGENRWQAIAHDTLCWPYGVALWNGTVAIADSGNNRVMLWQVSAAAAGSRAERSVPSCV